MKKIVLIALLTLISTVAFAKATAVNLNFLIEQCGAGNKTACAELVKQDGLRTSALKKGLAADQWVVGETVASKETGEALGKANDRMGPKINTTIGFAGGPAPARIGSAPVAGGETAYRGGF